MALAQSDIFLNLADLCSSLGYIYALTAIFHYTELVCGIKGGQHQSDLI